MQVLYVLVIMGLSACLVFTRAPKTMTYYVDFERINLTYYNPKYYKSVNVSARRYGRRDPIHYLHFHGEIVVPFGNNATVDIYIHEFLSNEYRRSFVEMHYKICDFILQDTIFRPFIEHTLPKTCPISVDTIFRSFIDHSLPKICFLPMGAYHFVNLSFPNLPLLSSFPFQKGRIFLEVKMRSERALEAYFDMEVKQRWH